MAGMLNVKVMWPTGASAIGRFDEILVRQVADIENLSEAIGKIFLPSCQVPDAWRYYLDVTAGTITSPLRLAPQRDLVHSCYQDTFAWRAAGKQPVLLLLESPHVDEFFYDTACVFRPKGPAQRSNYGGTGYGLRTYGSQVLSQLSLPTGSYPLIVVNPVPYHTSLRWLVTDVTKSTGRRKPKVREINPVVRDHVWSVLWQLAFMQTDFLSRCRNYAPVAVVNACTQLLQPQVTQFLRHHPVCSALYECSSHPSHWTRAFGKNGRGVQLTRV
ncbi:hypothetical protein ACFSQU_11995 [Massilia sp. GCM10020059]|uniref:Transposase n=1 Tax=Massilia agrisoli TaxID=2892444 RepID=A0ABS8IS51_9BURK|nr:hypothetical protein [Massilia agrisoli]MCC6070543.1 hypothetical protein [Massilia agrisoli]